MKHPYTCSLPTSVIAATSTADGLSTPRHGGALAPVVREGLDRPASPYADPNGVRQVSDPLPCGERLLQFLLFEREYFGTDIYQKLIWVWHFVFLKDFTLNVFVVRILSGEATHIHDYVDHQKAREHIVIFGIPLRDVNLAQIGLKSSFGLILMDSESLYKLGLKCSKASSRIWLESAGIVWTLDIASAQERCHVFHCCMVLSCNRFEEHHQFCKHYVASIYSDDRSIFHSLPCIPPEVTDGNGYGSKCGTERPKLNEISIGGGLPKNSFNSKVAAKHSPRNPRNHRYQNVFHVPPHLLGADQ